MTGITLLPHQIVRLPRKITLPNRDICRKQLQCHFQCATDPRISEHDPKPFRPRKRKTKPVPRRPAPATDNNTQTVPNAVPATKKSDI